MYENILKNIRHLLFIIAVIICLAISFQENSFSMDIFSHEPTVTVIDDETGKPIEGAVAIAIWRKHSLTEGAWFEGGKDVVTRIEEGVSDSSGNIYIDGFWDWHLFGLDPHLTIYKPGGYVCWDQGNIYIDEFHGPQRTDFDKAHRIARMKKWPEWFSFNAHSTFVNNITQDDFDDITKAPKLLFKKAFDFETPYAIKENTERNKKRKEMEEGKKRRDEK